MQIKQWEDKSLAHFSYAVLSDCEKKIVLIDPARDASPYLEYAAAEGAQIVGVIETHPHADFVSSHLEVHEKAGATIYVSELAGAQYPHEPLKEGSELRIGKVLLRALHTPGHSPDSLSIVLEHDGKLKAAFTGDTLFIGDCGRPDLREGAGAMQATREDLARQMYHSLRDKLMALPDDVLLYPAHGAGTLCGKALSKASVSTIGAERQTNWSLQEMSEAEFVAELLSDQPFVPKYFPFDVELNRTGAPALKASLHDVVIGTPVNEKTFGRLDPHTWIIDGRKEDVFKSGHLPHSVNLMEGNKFETWLGSIIAPGEPFYLAAEDEGQLWRLLSRAAAIGYEAQIREAFVLQGGSVREETFDVAAFREGPDRYTVVDVRNPSETSQGKPFGHSITIPLADLRERAHDIPTDKPIVVHCAGGYRSAAAASLLASLTDGNTKVYDMGENIRSFQV
ncbi:MBL fold metallo-hydrolase [Flaviaesturariibacter flavus]|uniref:MBL fold metallo-hydrolase n=1 Tax=Flaviaesturariibacter flavus TaxID=2502780 RepID=A0A4R1B7D5_9BACT|nr:MBL fold metallo-hydrolase [Flaviaesturariibacter flavus]TCJ12145.1 MBL fold metallo-hydrolase [Flaviaesturariibacter flavus]